MLEIVARPVPDPAPGEVRVRVRASGVNPHDTKRRSGWTGADMPPDGITPHSDGAGVVDAVGRGVDPDRIGTRVWLIGARPEGTAAEAVCIAADRAQPLPDGCDFAEGAALGVPAVTAWLALLADGPLTGQTVLIQGGGGAVGRVAVELAHRSGARVVATAGSADSRAIATAKGADLVLDRRADNVAAAVLDLTGGRGADRIVDVDFGANQPVTLAALADHGTVAAYSCSTDRTPALDYYAFARKSARLDFVQGNLLTPAQLSGAAACIGAFLAAGLLRPDLAAVLPFDETARAHEMVEAGASGNVVVTP
ncbi:NADPH:quinone reductase [Rhodobacteraceae bacterium CCMM004]|nr:NADPH:quinone reductase [Rhodobacteraceae bacterium CCMM004]